MHEKGKVRGKSENIRFWNSLWDVYSNKVTSEKFKKTSNIE